MASALLLSPVIVGWVTPLTPPTPPEWNQIHAGMSRSNIIALLGPAQAGGWPLKAVETWYRDGTLGLRKLDVYYSGEGDDRASRVREYIFWRPGRRHIVERSETQ